MEQNLSKQAAHAGKARQFPHRMLAEKSRPTIDVDNNWLITLSDVLSLLLVFFVMFFVVGKTAEKPRDEERHAVVTDADLPKAVSPVQERIVDEMSAEIQKQGLQDDVSVNAVNKEIVITLKEKITFRPGEAETLKSSEPVLDDIARIIEEHQAFRVDIEGNTDNVPINTRRYPSNWELSVARATSVLKYFITEHRIDPSRLSIKGNADQKPLALNDSPENRARNRRVEIRLMGEES